MNLESILKKQRNLNESLAFILSESIKVVNSISGSGDINNMEESEGIYPESLLLQISLEQNLMENLLGKLNDNNIKLIKSVYEPDIEVSVKI